MTQKELQIQSVMCCIQTKSKSIEVQTRSQAKKKFPSKKTSQLMCVGALIIVCL